MSVNKVPHVNLSETTEKFMKMQCNASDLIIYEQTDLSMFMLSIHIEFETILNITIIYSDAIFCLFTRINPFS